MFTYRRRINTAVRRRLHTRHTPLLGLLYCRRLYTRCSATPRTAAFHVNTLRRHAFLFTYFLFHSLLSSKFITSILIKTCLKPGLRPARLKMQDLENDGPNRSQRKVNVTLLVTFVQTMSLFATFHVPRSPHFPGLSFSSYCYFVVRHFLFLQIQRPPVDHILSRKKSKQATC